MKKLLLLTFAAVLGLSAHAQTGVLQRDPGTAETAQSFTSQKAPANKIDPAENQIWWGYDSGDGNRSGLGIQKAETYDVAICIPSSNSDIVGKTIKAIRFYLRDKDKTNNVKVWISKKLPKNISNADYVQEVSQSDLNAGDEGNKKLGKVNDIALTTPYTIGAEGVYVGYSFTVTSANSTTKYPIVTWENQEANSLFVRTSKSIKSWSDLSKEKFGKAAMQILVEGDFPKNIVAPVSWKDATVVKGNTVNTKLTLSNGGSNGIGSIDYVIETDGVAGAEQHLDINPPFKVMGGRCTIDLPLAADPNIGTTQKTITINKVNGETNNADKKSVACKLTTVSKLVKHGVVVEEYTGTGCPWCPRGLAGMKKMRDKFGEDFIGIGIHQYNQDDPMYCPNYAKLPFEGAPGGMIERRTGHIDPFYGTGEDVCDDFREALDRISVVGVSVSGELNTECTEVTATATIDPLLDGNYQIVYALIGDGLTGTTSSWKQANNYSNLTTARVGNDPYLTPYCQGGEHGQSYTQVVFDDVLLASSYNSKGTNSAKLDPLQEGQVVTNTYTLKLPTKTVLKNAIKNAGYDKLAVIAFVLNTKGKIENAAKFYLSVPAGIGGVTENKASQAVEVARYTVDGRRINAPQRGINIVKMSDGTTVKVMVK